MLPSNGNSTPVFTLGKESLQRLQTWSLGNNARQNRQRAGNSRFVKNAKVLFILIKIDIRERERVVRPRTRHA